MGDLFNNKTSFEVGDGRRLEFWKDRWVLEEPFCTSFPTLNALAIAKEA